MPIQLVPALLCRSVHSLGYLQRLKLEIWTFESEKQIYSNRRVDQIGWSNRVIGRLPPLDNATWWRVHFNRSSIRLELHHESVLEPGLICTQMAASRPATSTLSLSNWELHLETALDRPMVIDLTTLRSKTNNQVKTKGAHWCRWRSPHCLRPTLLNATVLISFRRKSLVQFWSLALSCWRCAVCRC